MQYSYIGGIGANALNADISLIHRTMFMEAFCLASEKLGELKQRINSVSVHVINEMTVRVAVRLNEFVTNPPGTIGSHSKDFLVNLDVDAPTHEKVCGKILEVFDATLAEKNATLQQGCTALSKELEMLRELRASNKSGNAVDGASDEAPISLKSLPPATRIAGDPPSIHPPACPSCGHETIRNGAAYKCLNCGESIG